MQISVFVRSQHKGCGLVIKEIVRFYNTRDVPEAGWPAGEVPETVNHDELGDLGLTNREEDDLVLFLQTLTDGYRFKMLTDGYR